MRLTDLQLKHRSFHIDIIFKKLNQQECLDLYPQMSLEYNSKIRQLRFLSPKYWNETVNKSMLYEYPYAELVRLSNY